MAKKVEIFTIGTPLCESTVQAVKEMVCSRCELIIYDARINEDKEVANSYNIQSFPAIAIDGVLTDIETLKKGKLGQYFHKKVIDKLKQLLN
ncbi:glutaredoxin [Metabacillus fastidiosus]|uniref:glutaredoxin n=1 Tax=Metabacillus fastidiosus TaxID=1458 RepID=UPI002E2464BF|nr:glutaredoxin [Metabacillus fastidiosus]